MARDENHDQLDFRAIVESVPAIVFIAATGDDGRWLYVNEWIEPILGFTVEEWMSDPGIWARQLHPDDRAKALAAEAHAVIDQTNRGSAVVARDPETEFFLDYRMLHKDGHVVWLRDSSTLVLSADGEPLWHGVMLDISDQKATEAELKRQSAGQAAVARLGEHALEQIPIQELLTEACEAAAQVLDVESAMVARLNPETGMLEGRAALGWSPRPPGSNEREPVNPYTQVGATLTTGRPVVINDWDAETNYVKSQPLIDHNVLSSVCVRVEGAAGPWGCFGVLSTQKHNFSATDVSFIQSLANVLADAIERQDAEDETTHRSLHDPLTGLPNRLLFADRLEQAFERLQRRKNALASILFIDVDHFKHVNDTLGHQAGDELLISVAQRLREAVRPTDTVARRSGDEFTVLLEEISSERDAIATAERIAAGFSRPFVLGTGTHFVTASLGIALADGHMLPTELLENADVAMYRAKERGRARYELFDEDMRVRAMARMRLESDLTRALDHGQLRLVYQPVIELSDESFSGVEALLRWTHPQRGEIPPDEFIPVAEENGLIDRIGRWVIEEALKSLAHWHQMRPDSAPLRMGINVSTYQLQSPRFVETLSEQITSVGVPPGSVHLEVSERVLLEDAEPLRQSLLALDELGVSLVMDDFGTGQSSLVQLARLPLRTLKVDRTFVASLGTNGRDDQIAHALISVGKALDMRVLGEGAETAEQVAELRRLGCTAVQGYLFSPPVSEAEITAMLANGGKMLRTVS